MTARGIDFTGIAYLVALAVGGFVVYRAVQAVPSVKNAVSGLVDSARGAVGAAVDAVTPTNPDNVFNRGFEAILKAATGKTPADLWPGGSTDGAALKTAFYAADLDDAELGAAMRRNALRGENPFLTTADLDDQEAGAAMAASAGMAFIDFSRIRRGMVR